MSEIDIIYQYEAPPTTVTVTENGRTAVYAVKPDVSKLPYQTKRGAVVSIVKANRPLFYRLWMRNYEVVK